MSFVPVVRYNSVAFSLALFVAGCDGVPTSLDQAGGAALAQGGKPVPTITSALIEWDDSLVVDIDGVPVAAGIRGDGRTANGSSGLSAVQGGLCGVGARIWNGSGESGDMIFDEYTATGCGALRVHSFYLNGSGAPPHVVASKTNARALWTMSVGEVRTDLFEGFHVGSTQCDKMDFDAQYAGSSYPKRTRLPDLANGARQWRVESQPPHRGICLATVRGKTVVVFSAVVPWAYTVTEVK